MSSAALLAQSRTCAACGKSITKDFLEYNGQPYCSQKCFEAALPKCSVCGKSVGEGTKQGEFLKVNGKIFCSDKCFERSLPKCAACGKPAKKQLRSADDTSKVYCSPECYQTSLPKCELCQKPLNSWKEMSGHIYCKDCADLPSCLDCRLPGASIELTDGRHICQACKKEAVISRDQGQKLFEKVRADIEKHLGLSTDHRITFQLVDAQELGRITGVKVFSEQGLYSHKWKTYQTAKTKVPDSDTFVVYILSYLTPKYFYNIAAHELAHDIHDARFPYAKGKEQEEGFAEYVSSLMNAYWGNDSLNAEKLQNQEKIYAQGYLKFLQIAEKNGLPDVLAYMEKQNRATKPKTIKKKTK
ncbi:MAG: LIM domain-containing protein [Candidatus Edwardsbacteria bacterium]|nr:LIM domain-containing protein [Candidatus Edwardsbacteria bacterium]